MFTRIYYNSYTCRSGLTWNSIKFVSLLFCSNRSFFNCYFVVIGNFVILEWIDVLFIWIVILDLGINSQET